MVESLGTADWEWMGNATPVDCLLSITLLRTVVSVATSSGHYVSRNKCSAIAVEYAFRHATESDVPKQSTLHHCARVCGRNMSGRFLRHVCCFNYCGIASLVVCVSTQKVKLLPISSNDVIVERQTPHKLCKRNHSASIDDSGSV